MVLFKERFEEKEFWKWMQFMYGTDLQRIVFGYSGISLETVLDRMSMAKVVDDMVVKNKKREDIYDSGGGVWKWN